MKKAENDLKNAEKKQKKAEKELKANGFECERSEQMILKIYEQPFEFKL